MGFNFKFSALLGVICATALMATGPRVSPNLIAVEKPVVYALDLPPFISTEVEREGALSEIVVTAFSEQNIDVIITVVPLQSMLNYYLLEENALAVMGRHLGIRHDAQKKLVSIPLYISAEHYLYYKPMHKKLTDEDTRSNRKNLTYGASKGEDVTAFQKASIHVKKSRSLSMFKKLKQGKVDFISMPPESTKWYMANKYADEKSDFAVIESKPREVPIAIHFNLDNPEGKQLSAAFRQGLKTMVKNGKYSEILEKHLKEPATIKLQLGHINNALK